VTPEEERGLEVRRRQRRNALVTALALGAIVILIFAIAMVRMTVRP
jgi:CHASE3 domain sensor protein